MDKKVKKEFDPKIVGFLCNWCTYAAADLAGSSKMEISPALSVVRVMCSSRVDHNLVLTTFFNGADGILIAGCHPGDCHYGEGNYYARRRYALLKKVTESLGLESERLQLTWISASEGNRYAEVVNSFTEKIAKLGPSPINCRSDL
ncbi:MAG: hydrogenase iron-sulfur subunit [Candidatus Krumholzibacteriota bacterium]|nr:hydrogenase iron-sulfur subunit [Candidatus Krumholzibacteriota bacterium]